MAEYWDLYDIDRQKSGKTFARGQGVPAQYFHNVVHLLLINSKGALLIQRRAENKPTWPGLWDITVGGSVLAGETSREGIARETREELGLELDFSDTRPLMTFNFPAGFDDYYVLYQDVDLDQLSVPNEEVAEVAWASLDDIKRLRDAGAFIAYRDSLLDFLVDYGSRRDVMELPGEFQR